MHPPSKVPALTRPGRFRVNPALGGFSAGAHHLALTLFSHVVQRIAAPLVGRRSGVGGDGAVCPSGKQGHRSPCPARGEQGGGEWIARQNGVATYSHVFFFMVAW